MTSPHTRLRVRSDLTPSDQALLRLYRWAEAGICTHCATVTEGSKPVYLLELPGARFLSVGQRELLAMSDHPEDAAEALAELAVTS